MLDEILTTPSCYGRPDELFVKNWKYKTNHKTWRILAIETYPSLRKETNMLQKKVAAIFARSREISRRPSSTAPMAVLQYNFAHCTWDSAIQRWPRNVRSSYGICPTKDRWLPRNYKILIKRLYKPDKQTKKWLLEIEKSGENDSIMTHLTEWHTRDWKKCLNDCCHRFVDGIVQCRKFSRSHVQSVRIKA